MSIQAGINKLVTSAVGVAVAKDQLMNKQLDESIKMHEKSLDTTKTEKVISKLQEAAPEIKQSIDKIMMEKARSAKESKRQAKMLQASMLRNRFNMSVQGVVRGGREAYGEK